MKSTHYTQKILDNGPDGQKLVFVVVGDGYAAADLVSNASGVLTGAGCSTRFGHAVVLNNRCANPYQADRGLGLISKCRQHLAFFNLSAQALSAQIASS
jgi:hypothetical protein